MKRPYQPPELRRLELDQLTSEQRAWVEEERRALATADVGPFVNALEAAKDELSRAAHRPIDWPDPWRLVR